MVVIETYFAEPHWCTKAVGVRQAPIEGKYNNREDAVKAGGTIAECYGGEHIIRDMAGNVEQRNTYDKPEPVNEF